MIIIAVFRNGRSVLYTKGVLELLKSDSEVVTIYDAVTGEIVFQREVTA